MGQTVTRVLVVDDDEGIRRLAGYLLGSAGYEVATASDGREALRVINREPPDVIVLDLNMPVMDGYTLVREMGTAGCRPPILILSAEEAEKARRELGADASLRKPFLPDDLVRKVQSLSPLSRSAN